MIKYYKKKCISAKNSDLSWALHSLDCLEANIFKTTFFARFLHISRHFWQRKMTSLGSYLKWHLAPVFCRLKNHLLQFDGIFSQDQKEMVFCDYSSKEIKKWASDDHFSKFERPVTEIKANYLTFMGLYHLHFGLETIGVSLIIIWDC